MFIGRGCPNVWAGRKVQDALHVLHRASKRFMPVANSVVRGACTGSPSRKVGVKYCRGWWRLARRPPYDPQERLRRTGAIMGLGFALDVSAAQRDTIALDPERRVSQGGLEFAFDWSPHHSAAGQARVLTGNDNDECTVSQQLAIFPCLDCSCHCR